LTPAGGAANFPGQTGSAGQSAWSQTVNALTDDAKADDTAMSPVPPRRGWLKPVLRLVALVVVLIVGGVTLRWWMAEGRFIESTDNAYVQGDIATLAARIDGVISAVLVADNQAVKTGDPLITIDPRDWQARRDQAEAAVREAEAGLATAQRQAAQARTAIDQAEAGIAQAQAEHTRATADASRSTALVGAGWTSRQANDLAVADARKATAGLANAQAQRAWNEQALSAAETQQAAAAARLANARAQLRLAENNVDYTTIRAPFDGIVGNRAAQVGQPVQPGMQLIAVAPPPGKLYVVANYKETQLRRMRAGDPVTLTPDIDPDGAVTGHVDSLAPATGALFSLLPPENATGNFTKVVQRVPVRITIDLPPGTPPAWLRAGLSVIAETDTRGPAAVRHGLLGLW
jgi:membrane fusion protein (multidrug efflux system)